MKDIIKGYKGAELEVLCTRGCGVDSMLYLVKQGTGYYAYGTMQDMQSLLGVPVNQCGTKEEVMAHCMSIANLCQENIDSYKKEHDYEYSTGWKLLVEYEQERMKALTTFANVLSFEE